MQTVKKHAFPDGRLTWIAGVLCVSCLTRGRGMDAVSFFPREEQGVAAFPSMVDAVRVLPEVTDIFTPSLEEWRKQFFLFFLKIFLY